LKFEIYHQLGHNHKWNLQSLYDDGIGSGVIIAPRYIERAHVEELDAEIRESAIFDPQFFLPDTAKGKLSTYDFFPNIVADGFKTSEYEGEFAFEGANQCLDFQLANGFRYLVIPTRYASGMPSDFINQQEKLFIEPFLATYQAR